MKKILFGLMASVAAATGCTTSGSDRYANLVDPCWPERYNYEARQVALQPFQTQAANGAIINQTVWNYHFQPGTATLTRSGQETLDQFVTRRPSPDARVYLQTTRDIGYDAEHPTRYADKRRDLDAQRAKAVHAYLEAQTASRPMSFEVQVIDPNNPAINVRYGLQAVNALRGQYGASLGGAGGGGGAGATGGAGGGAGGGGGGF